MCACTVQCILLASIHITSHHSLHSTPLANNICKLCSNESDISGKSTLFNALTESQGAEAANYPFCTIDPNVGLVRVPDKRLENLTTVNTSVKTVPTALEFVDVAGLIKGASKGEGLGNKFLDVIRQCGKLSCFGFY